LTKIVTLLTKKIIKTELTQVNESRDKCVF